MEQINIVFPSDLDKDLFELINIGVNIDPNDNGDLVMAFYDSNGLMMIIGPDDLKKLRDIISIANIENSLSENI